MFRGFSRLKLWKLGRCIALTLIIAIAAEVIAYRKMMISSKQLKRDLFIDRMKLFDAVIDVIIILIRLVKVNDH